LNGSSGTVENQDGYQGTFWFVWGNRFREFSPIVQRMLVGFEWERKLRENPEVANG
jgi:hypothetical protein